MLGRFKTIDFHYFTRVVVSSLHGVIKASHPCRNRSFLLGKDDDDDDDDDNDDISLLTTSKGTAVHLRRA